VFDGEEEYSSIEEVSEWIAKNTEVDIIEELIIVSQTYYREQLSSRWKLNPKKPSYRILRSEYRF
jgi:hypothetical protein